MHSLKQSRQFFLRRHIIICLTLLILCSVTIYYISQRDVYGEPFIVEFESVNTNVSCHDLEDGDALPSAEDAEFLPRPNSIFFHETSCKGGLTSRQACAVESAARAHPRRQIYVMFSAPVSEFIYRRSCIAKLQQFKNIKFARVHIKEYAKKTPLEEMVAKKPFAESQWWMEHTSDVLRYLTLYKFGGVYLDTDMLVTKSLTPLGHNWVAREDNSWVNAAAIAISNDHLGRRLADALMNEVKTTYRPDIWIHNGPGAITRVLHKMCSSQDLAEWSSKTCDGLEVYGPEYFFPLHYSRKDDYFKPGELSEKAQQAYTHHFWNKLTFDMNIEKGSPYDTMAEKHCPTIYGMYGDRFGS
ncbi:lactosylceramide 4-alpha-galactosyltransferase-like [Anticarsia gemmatalis]|uniref:lactosylceramide 4-alpha-galactosyltransferase-like n=1 Tax=Anticarsia gemmatalis TaxID=129554 RepID=UPI003F76EF5A